MSTLNVNEIRSADGSQLLLSTTSKTLLDVVHTVKTDIWSAGAIAPPTWAAVSGLTATITPKAIGSKILVSIVANVNSAY